MALLFGQVETSAYITPKQHRKKSPELCQSGGEWASVLLGAGSEGPQRAAPATAAPPHNALHVCSYMQRTAIMERAGRHAAYLFWGTGYISAVSQVRMPSSHAWDSIANESASPSASPHSMVPAPTQHLHELGRHAHISFTGPAFWHADCASVLGMLTVLAWLRGGTKRCTTGWIDGTATAYYAIRHTIHKYTDDLSCI